MPEVAPDDEVAVGWAWTTGSTTGRVLRARLDQGDDPAPTEDELREIRREWNDAGRPPPPKGHVHRDPVELSDGATVVAVSFNGDDPYRRDDVPAFGLYLDARWDPPWPHEHIDWPDFGIPADSEELVRALTALHARARSGERVEIGCLGGHGRTGTALACLAVLTGTRPEEAVEWVRTHYCERAVEIPDQRRFVSELAPGGSP